MRRNNVYYYSVSNRGSCNYFFFSDESKQFLKRQCLKLNDLKTKFDNYTWYLLRNYKFIFFFTRSVSRTNWKSKS